MSTMRELPDPAFSQAVLVGVSRYGKMSDDRQLPSVERGINRLAELLTDRRLWGLPAKNCAVLHQPVDADAVIGALRTSLSQAKDTVLFYYAGHGLVDPALQGDELHLALPQSYEPGGTHLALRYAHIRREFRVNTRGLRRVVILDCCWSGLAANTEGGNLGLADLLVSAAIEGTAVLTATAATKKALAPPEEDYPFFTGALIQLLEQGIPGGPRVLDMATLYEHAADQLEEKKGPRPEFVGGRSGANIRLAKNAAWRPDAIGHAPNNLAEMVAALRRIGRYREADELQRQAAEAGARRTIAERVNGLRRLGLYEEAQEIESAGTSSPDDLGDSQLSHDL